MTNAPFDFEREARGLGRAAGDAIDPEQVAARVLNRLRQRAPWWRSTPLLRAAAVIALLGGGAVLGRLSMANVGDAPVPSRAATGMLEGLSANELSEVLDSMALETPPSMLLTPRLHDLSEAQLKELLSMES
jgi:hypothetical protein